MRNKSNAVTINLSNASLIKRIIKNYVTMGYWMVDSISAMVASSITLLTAMMFGWEVYGVALAFGVIIMIVINAVISILKTFFTVKRLSAALGQNKVIQLRSVKKDSWGGGGPVGHA